MVGARRSRWLQLHRLVFLLLFVLFFLHATPSQCVKWREAPPSVGGRRGAPFLSVGPPPPFASLADVGGEGSVPISAKKHLFSVEELFAEVSGQHWQPLEVLLQRGASRGALAKVAWQQQQREAFAGAAAAAKKALESCEAEEEEEVCSRAKAEARAANSGAAAGGLKIGPFKEGSAAGAPVERSSTTAADAAIHSHSSSNGSSSKDSSKSSSLVQVEGVISSVWDNLFGGAGAGNADNFQGGNQGSYFNFMYPSDNDYPWACVCDEGQYNQWLNKQVQYVPCRNQVDLSTQNVVAMCNPENHTLNAATGGPPAAAAAVAFAAAVVALSFAHG
ncbi:hypothetical protein Efla_001049 [Eimeria flavescens]